MLKKLTTNNVSQEKKEVTERTANLCLSSACMPYCGGLKTVYYDTFNSIRYSGF
jgi:hypothetical protein